MTATQEIDTILSGRELPVEFLRLPSSSQPGAEPRLASMVSGMIAARQPDEVICPLMLRRNLLIPAHHGTMARSAWHVE